MKKALVLIIGLIALLVPTAARATPLASGCVYGAGGCIYLVDGTNDPLWVHTLQAGVHDHYNTQTYCGNFEVARNGKIIHESVYKCIVPANSPRGPVYTQNKDYLNGDVFCGWFSGYLPDKQGCVTVHN